MMRSIVILASGLAFAALQPASAQNRDSDGEVISVRPQIVYHRDSDGEVISVHEYVTYYRDAAGHVIAVIPIVKWEFLAMENAYMLDTVDGTVIQIAAQTNADGQAELPQQVAIDGLNYQVSASDDEFILRAESRINPVAFTLE